MGIATLHPSYVLGDAMTKPDSTQTKRDQTSKLRRDHPIRVEIIPQQKGPYEKLTQHIPLFISILALALSIWSAFESRRHDRLSVRPDIRFHRETNSGGKEVGLYIMNDGLGPAIIRNMRTYLDGKLISDVDEIAAQTVTNYKRTTPGWHYSKFDFTIKTAETFALLFTDPENVQSMGAFSELIRRRVFVIAKACSFYDECRVFCSTVDDDQCEIEERKVASGK
jgi:hypothetical protein